MNALDKFAFAKSGNNSSILRGHQGDCSYEDFLELVLFRFSNVGGLEGLPAAGDYIYTDNGLSIPFDGGNQWYKLGFDNSEGIQFIYHYNFRINSAGLITGVITCEGTGPTTLEISSTAPDVSNNGSIAITGGEADETISVQVSFYQLAEFGIEEADSCSFSGTGVVIPTVDQIHTIRNGSVVLSGTGSRTITYDVSPDTAEQFIITIQITARSSGEPLPAVDSTTFSHS